jgi:hypothetical protein
MPNEKIDNLPPFGPDEGESAASHIDKDRRLNLFTKDGVQIGGYSRGLCRVMNPEKWATYFRPPIRFKG